MRVGILALTLILEENLSVFHHWVCWQLFVMLKYVPLWQLWWVFIMNGCWILSNYFSLSIHMIMDFLGGSDSKESAWSVEDLGLIPELGRSPGEGNGYPLQYSGLENFMDRGAWQATVHGIAKSRTWLSDLHFHTLFTTLGQGMVGWGISL